MILSRYLSSPSSATMVRGCFNCGGPHYQQSCELLCMDCPNSTHAGKDCHNCPVRRSNNLRGRSGVFNSQRGERPDVPNGHDGTGTWNNGGCPVYPTMALTPNLNMNQQGIYSYAPSSIQDTSGLYYQNNAPGYPYFPGTGTSLNTHGQPMSPFRGAARPGQQRKSTQHNQISSTNPTAPWDILQQRLYANREHFPCSWCGDYYHCLLDCPGQLTKWRAPLRTWIVQSGYENFAGFFIVSLQEWHRPNEVAPFMTARRRPYYSRTENPNSMGIAEAQGQGRGEGRGGGDGGSVTLDRQDENRQPGEDEPAPPTLPLTQTAFDEQRSPQHQIDQSNIDMLGGVTLT